MKRTILAISVALAATLGLSACTGLALEDNGNYKQYSVAALELAKEAQATERARINALANIAMVGDDRTRDQIVRELEGKRSAGSDKPALAAPAPATNLALEALRTLGPGAIGLVAQGISAWSANEADIRATERYAATNSMIQGIVSGAIDANSAIASQSVEGANAITGQAVGKLPATITVTVPAASSEAAE